MRRDTLLNLRAWRASAAAIAFTLLVPAAASAQTLTGAPLAEAPPDALAAPVRAALAASGTRVTSGAVSLDFWWVKQLPVAAASDVTWMQVAEGSLVGAVRLSAAWRDIRGRTIKPGVYTLRYAVQPADGDHLGVSPYRDFLLLSPAAEDTGGAPAGHDGTIKMSRDTVGASHPAPWSLDPPVTSAPLLSTGTDMDLTYIVFEVPTTGAKPLRFGLVLIGRIEA
jgi:hypothetical protein